MCTQFSELFEEEEDLIPYNISIDNFTKQYLNSRKLTDWSKKRTRNLLDGICGYSVYTSSFNNYTGADVMFITDSDISSLKLKNSTKVFKLIQKFQSFYILNYDFFELQLKGVKYNKLMKRPFIYWPKKLTDWTYAMMYFHASFCMNRDEREYSEILTTLIKCNTENSLPALLEKICKVPSYYDEFITKYYFPEVLCSVSHFFSVFRLWDSGALDLLFRRN